MSAQRQLCKIACYLMKKFPQDWKVSAGQYNNGIQYTYLQHEFTHIVVITGIFFATVSKQHRDFNINTLKFNPWYGYFLNRRSKKTIRKIFNLKNQESRKKREQNFQELVGQLSEFDEAGRIAHKL